MTRSSQAVRVLFDVEVRIIHADTRPHTQQQLNDLVVQVATLSRTVEKLKQLLSAQHEHVSKLTASLDYHDRHHAEQEATTITVKRVDTSESSTKNTHTRKRDIVLRPFTRARADSESTLAETEEKEPEKVTFWPRGLPRVHWH